MCSLDLFRNFYLCFELRDILHLVHQSHSGAHAEHTHTDTRRHSHNIISTTPHKHTHTHKRTRALASSLHSLLNVSGAIKYLQAIAPRLATEDEILLVHSRDYLERIQTLDATGGETGDCAPMCTGG